MSYYLIHLLSPNISLYKDRGSLHYIRHGEEERKLPLEDIRGVIIATQEVKLTDRLIVALAENGAFILHCDKKYQPIALTEPLVQTVKKTVLINQTRATKKLQADIWQSILQAKTQNQKIVLQSINAEYSYLEEHLNNSKINESACARYYWSQYFANCGFPGLTRRHDDTHDINKMLNYAYAVLGALCHRSIVGHGMIPNIGIHHQANFHNHPLVYDLIEPLRPFVDKQLYAYLSNATKEISVKEWVTASQNCWKDIRVMYKDNRLKLIDSIDTYITSVTKAFAYKDSQHIWFPRLKAP